MAQALCRGRRAAARNQAEGKVLAQDGAQIEQRGIARGQLASRLFIHTLYTPPNNRFRRRGGFAEKKRKDTSRRNHLFRGAFLTHHHRTAASRAGFEKRPWPA